MKTNFILFFVCILLCSFSFAQNKSEQINKNSKTVNIYTSLKPLDGLGYVFSSEEDLISRVPNKKSGIISQIVKNEKDSLKVKMLREELWRFENAVVK